MSDRFYQKINTYPQIINKFYKDKGMNSLVLYSYFGFEGSPMGPHIYLQEPFINDVNKIFPIKYAGVIKLHPYRVYNWHVDTERRVAINMLLTANNDSHCLFSDDINQIQIKTTELKYDPDTFYLFNTQYPHMVLNGHSDRWLFSVEFQPNIDYNMVLAWLKDNNYV